MADPAKAAGKSFLYLHEKIIVDTADTVYPPPAPVGVATCRPPRLPPSYLHLFFEKYSDI